MAAEGPLEAPRQPEHRRNLTHRQSRLQHTCAEDANRGLQALKLLPAAIASQKMRFDGLLFSFRNAPKAVRGQQTACRRVVACVFEQFASHSFSRLETGQFPPQPMAARKCSRARSSRCATADFRRPIMRPISSRVYP